MSTYIVTGEWEQAINRYFKDLKWQWLVGLITTEAFLAFNNIDAFWSVVEQQAE